MKIVQVIDLETGKDITDEIAIPVRKKSYAELMLEQAKLRRIRNKKSKKKRKKR